MTAYSGGCQCGAVRYRVTGELADPHLCHCRMCQKAAGNYFMPLGGAKMADFTVTRGAPAWFQSSEPVRRGFCSACGTPLFFHDTTSGDHIAITLGSLDDPAAVRPVSVYGTEAIMPWLADVAAMTGRETEDEASSIRDILEIIRATNHQHPDHDTDTWPAGGRS